MNLKIMQYTVASEFLSFRRQVERKFPLKHVDARICDGEEQLQR